MTYDYDNGVEAGAKKEREAIERIVSKSICYTCSESMVYVHEVCDELNKILVLIDARNYKEKEEK
jgi:hypothetical protein